MVGGCYQQVALPYVKIDDRLLLVQLRPNLKNLHKRMVASLHNQIHPNSPILEPNHRIDPLTQPATLPISNRNQHNGRNLSIVRIQNFNIVLAQQAAQFEGEQADEALLCCEEQVAYVGVLWGFCVGD